MWLAWKVRLIPSLARSQACLRVTSWPKASTVPWSGVVKPFSTSKSVDLPDPLGPIRPTKEWAGTSIDAPRRAWTPPKRLWMSVARSTVPSRTCSGRKSSTVSSAASSPSLQSTASSAVAPLLPIDASSGPQSGRAGAQDDLLAVAVAVAPGGDRDLRLRWRSAGQVDVDLDLGVDVGDAGALEPGGREDRHLLLLLEDLEQVSAHPAGADDRAGDQPDAAEEIGGEVVALERLGDQGEGDGDGGDAEQRPGPRHHRDGQQEQRLEGDELDDGRRRPVERSGERPGHADEAAADGEGQDLVPP